MATIGKKAAVVIPDAADAPSVQDIIDAYVYLTGRLLVLCQEHLDFTRNGFRWNTLVHREAVGFTSANPNLDVAYSEAWIAVDDHSCTLIEVPPIVGRYYTIHLVDMNQRMVPFLCGILNSASNDGVLPSTWARTRDNTISRSAG